MDYLHDHLVKIRTALVVLSEHVEAMAHSVYRGDMLAISDRLIEAAHSLSGLSGAFRGLSQEIKAQAGEPATTPPQIPQLPEFSLQIAGVRLIFDRRPVAYTHQAARFSVPEGTRLLRVEPDGSGREFAVDLEFKPDGTFPADWDIPFHVVNPQPALPAPVGKTLVVYTRRTEAERAAADESSDESFVHDTLVVHATDEPGILAPPLYWAAGLTPHIDYEGLEKWLDNLEPVELDTGLATAAIANLGLLVETNLGWTQRFTHANLQVPEYGRDIATLIGDVGLAMHDKNIPLLLRRTALYRLLQIGLDAHANLRASRFSDGKDFAYEADGGHGNGRYYPYLLAAELLGLSTGWGQRFSEIGQSYEVSTGLWDWRMRPGLHTNRAASYPPGSQEEKAEKYRVLACNSIIATLVPAELQGLDVDPILRHAMQSHITWRSGQGLPAAYGLASDYLETVDPNILNY